MSADIEYNEDVKSVTGTAVDNTDPKNPIVDLQDALQVAISDVLGNYTATDVEGALAEIASSLTGLGHTAITGIDLKPTGTPNEFTVEIEWTDENGTPQTTTDPTPITITHLSDSEIKIQYENNANTNAFTDAEKTNLGNQSGTNTGDEVQATELIKGIAEISTQAETNAGTDDTRFITPLKLKNFPAPAPTFGESHYFVKDDSASVTNSTTYIVATLINTFFGLVNDGFYKLSFNWDFSNSVSNRYSKFAIRVNGVIIHEDTITQGVADQKYVTSYFTNIFLAGGNNDSLELLFLAEDASNTVTISEVRMQLYRTS